jgi:hypothetical protein
MVGILFTVKIQEGGPKYFFMMMSSKMTLFWREGDQAREKVREKERERKDSLQKTNFLPFCLFRWEKHLGSLGRIKRSQSPISPQSEFQMGLPKI